jgi:hypothetical protein
MFEAGRDGDNSALLYAGPDRKYSSQFNAGRMLLRPDNAIAETRVLAIVAFGSWMKRHDQVERISDFTNVVFNK